MERYHQNASQASDANPFNSARQSGNSASVPTTLLHTDRLHEPPNGAAEVLPALGSLISRGVVARCGNDRTLTACYFAFVLIVRLFLKSNAATCLPAVVVMVLEDGLSFASFLLGLIYLHNSDGIARMILRKRAGDSNADRAPAPNAAAPPQPQQTRPEDVKLFLFAM